MGGHHRAEQHQEPAHRATLELLVHCGVQRLRLRPARGVDLQLNWRSSKPKPRTLFGLRAHMSRVVLASTKRSAGFGNRSIRLATSRMVSYRALACLRGVGCCLTQTVICPGDMAYISGDYKILYGAQNGRGIWFGPVRPTSPKQH